MSQIPASRRTPSTQGSSRLALSVGKTGAVNGNATSAPERHPLKHDWSVSYVHRPTGTKVDYEKEIKRVATFGSIESFLHIYSHLTPTNELQPVTDVLWFDSRILTPGVWEAMPDGGKFTIRLVHPITPLLYESLLLALIGDQFAEEDRVVGCVLSARQQEDLISVWVEDEGEALRSGALREKILSVLGLPTSAICEYRSNRALLDAVTAAPSHGNNNSNSLNNHSAPSTMAAPMSNSNSGSNRTYNTHPPFSADEGGGRFPRGQGQSNGVREEAGEEGGAVGTPGRYGGRPAGRGAYSSAGGGGGTGPGEGMRNGWGGIGGRARE